MQDIIYRLTLYKEDNSTLTPVSGSSGSPVHNDPFVVTTYPVSGAKPYITSISPNSGRAVLPDSKWEVGTYYIELGDIRTATSNLERWVTAFIGDGEGRYALIGKKASVEESLDGGSTWTPQFVGRVDNLTNTSPLKYRIKLTDESDRLQRKLFGKVPSEAPRSVITRKMLLPLGWEYKEETGRQIAPYDTVTARRGYLPTYGQYITLGAAAIKLDDNLGDDLKWYTTLTDDFTKYARAPLKAFGSATFFINLFKEKYAICRVYNNSDVLIGDYAVYGFLTKTITTDNDQTTLVDTVYVAEINPISIGGAGILDLPSTGTFKIKIFPPDTPEAIGDYPYLITPTGSLIDVLRDALEGHYDQLYNTGSYIGITYDESNFSQIESIKTSASGSYDKFQPVEKHFYVDEQVELYSFIEDNILKPNGLGYYLEPKLSGGVPSSEFKLFLLDRPTSTPAVTIEDEHVIATKYIDWSMTPSYKIDRNYKFLVVNEINEDNAELTSIIDNNIISYDTVALINNKFTTHDIEPKVVSILSPTEGQQYITQPKEIVNRFSKGVPRLQVSLVRGEYETLSIGDWVNIDIQWQPNIGTLKRGGTRLMQVVSKYANKTELVIELLDAGINDQLDPPTINSFSISDGFTAAVEVGYTGSIVATVGTEYAIVNTNSLPSEYSDEWNFLSRDELSATDSTATNYITNVPSNKYVFIRARTETDRSNDLKLPSSYVYSSGNSTNTISNPTGLSVVTASYYTAEVSWTASPSYSAEIYSTGNEAGSLELYTTVPPLSNNITLPGFNLAPTSGQQWGLRFIDQRGGASAIVSQSFTRGGATNQAPDLAGIFIFTESFL